MAAGTGPRMSNAVARKLGLAPQRTANEARLAKLRSAGSGGMTPPRTSLDGILQALHGTQQRASLEQQMVNQQMLAAAGARAACAAAALRAGCGCWPRSLGCGAPVGQPASPSPQPALPSVQPSKLPAARHQGPGLGFEAALPRPHIPTCAALRCRLQAWPSSTAPP